MEERVQTGPEEPQGFCSSVTLLAGTVALKVGKEREEQANSCVVYHPPSTKT